jgi:hypothetical protein
MTLSGSRLQQAALRVPPDPLLSVAIPVFNERTTIEEIIDCVPEVKMGIELIVVDDVATVGMTEILGQFQKTRRSVLLRQPHNGAASRRSPAASSSSTPRIRSTMCSIVFNG